MCLISLSLTVPGYPVKQINNAGYIDIANRLLKKGLTELGAFHYLEQLTSLGPRLTGSPEAAAAVELMQQKMLDLDLDNVHLEPTKVCHWIRGEKEEAFIVSSSFGTIPVDIAAIGGSISTPKKGITGSIIEIVSFE